MKLKAYIENLNKLVEKNPKAAEYDVVTSIDNEGNDYNLVCFNPSVGIYKDYSGEFEEANKDNEEDINAVCVN